MFAEREIDGFTRFDGTIKFYSYVRAIMLRYGVKTVLDFGAGRGASFHDDASHYRRNLRDLTVTGAHVVACDVDAAVMDHPKSHERVVLQPGQPLPFPDANFDLIVSDMTFEHIEDPDAVSRELARILRPGGFICARTPNAWGYVRVASSLVPNTLHATLLSVIQPERKVEDVFPTCYRMNSPAGIRRHFPGFELFHIHDSADPAYHFNSDLLQRGFAILHKLLPDILATTLMLFLRKPQDGRGG